MGNLASIPLPHPNPKLFKHCGNTKKIKFEPGHYFLLLIAMTQYFVVMLLWILAGLLLPGCRKSPITVDGISRIDAPAGIRWNRVYFLDDQHGFIVGGQRFDQAAMMITRDGGETWTYHSFPEIGKGLYGIQGKGEQVWACGFDGHLLFSENQGQDWTHWQSPSWLPLQDISAGPDSGWILVSGVSFREGNLVYLDADRQQVRRDSFGIEWRRILLDDTQPGFLVGYGAVMKTKDGGRNWAYTSLKNDDFRDIHRTEARVWICGYQGKVYSSGDQGETWSSWKIGPSLSPSPSRLLCLYFADDRQGWAAGEQGFWARTRDGGESWQVLEPFTKAAIRDMALSPHGRLILVGDGGTLYQMDLNP